MIPLVLQMEKMESGRGRWRPPGRRGRRRVPPLPPVRGLVAEAPAGPGRTPRLRKGLRLRGRHRGLSAVTAPALPLLEMRRVVRGGGFRPGRAGRSPRPRGAGCQLLRQPACQTRRRAHGWVPVPPVAFAFIPVLIDVLANRDTRPATYGDFAG